MDVIGVATNAATVTVNNQPTYRKGTYYRAELPINNASGPVSQSVTNLAALHEGTNSDVVTNINGNILLPPVNQTFSYDADGNLTRDGVWNYGWDGENRLISMTNVPGLATSAQKQLRFAYDYLGRRIQKSVFTNSGVAWVPISTNTFIYDGWSLFAEVNAANNGAIRTYTSGTGESGLVAVRIPLSGVQFCIYDANGNIAALCDATDSNVTARYEYGPFGETIRQNGATGYSNPIRHSAKYCDDDTGLYYYGFRYYNPATAVWLSKDPNGDRKEHNLYAFCENDSLNRIDSVGLAWHVSIKKAIPLYDVRNPFYGLDNPPPWGPHYGVTYVSQDIEKQTDGPCNSGCGQKLEDYYLDVIIQQQFYDSQEDAANPHFAPGGRDKGVSTQTHEDAHATFIMDAYSAMAGAYQQYYNKCLRLPCFTAYEQWRADLTTYVFAVSDYNNDYLDFKDYGAYGQQTLNTIIAFEEQYAGAVRTDSLQIKQLCSH